MKLSEAAHARKKDKAGAVSSGALGGAGGCSDGNVSGKVTRRTAGDDCTNTTRSTRPTPRARGGATRETDMRLTTTSTPDTT